MTDEKQHSEAQPMDPGVDVEGLLAAIQARTSGEIREWMEPGQPLQQEVNGQVFRTCSELAEAFEIGICDFRACEASR